MLSPTGLIANAPCARHFLRVAGHDGPLTRHDVPMPDSVAQLVEAAWKINATSVAKAVWYAATVAGKLCVSSLGENIREYGAYLAGV